MKAAGAETQPFFSTTQQAILTITRGRSRVDDIYSLCVQRSLVGDIRCRHKTKVSPLTGREGLPGFPAARWRCRSFGPGGWRCDHTLTGSAVNKTGSSTPIEMLEPGFITAPLSSFPSPISLVSFTRYLQKRRNPQTNTAAHSYENQPNWTEETTMLCACYGNRNDRC